MNDKDTVVVPDQLTTLVQRARGYVADAMNEPGEKYPPIMATYVREGVPSASASILVDTAVTAVAFALQDLAAAPSTSVREEVGALVTRLRAYRPVDEWGEGVRHTICDEAADALEDLAALKPSTDKGGGE